MTALRLAYSSPSPSQRARVVAELAELLQTLAHHHTLRDALKCECRCLRAAIQLYPPEHVAWHGWRERLADSVAKWREKARLVARAQARAGRLVAALNDRPALTVIEGGRAA